MKIESSEARMRRVTRAWYELAVESILPLRRDNEEKSYWASWCTRLTVLGQEGQA